MLQATSSVSTTWPAPQAVDIEVEYYHCESGEYWVVKDSECYICADAKDIGEQDVSSCGSQGTGVVWYSRDPRRSLGGTTCWAVRLAPCTLLALYRNLCCRGVSPARFRRCLSVAGLVWTVGGVALLLCLVEGFLEGCGVD